MAKKPAAKANKKPAPKAEPAPTVADAPLDPALDKQIHIAAARGRGRPKVELRSDQIRVIRGLGKVMASRTEIAYALDMDLRTLNRLFKEDAEAVVAYEQGLELAKISLRHMQFELAKKSAGMAIWLGKQYLGQKDVHQQIITGANGGPVETTASLDIGSLNDDDLAELVRILEGAGALDVPSDVDEGEEDSGGAEPQVVH
jgi:hypothetical protein